MNLARSVLSWIGRHLLLLLLVLLMVVFVPRLLDTVGNAIDEQQRATARLTALDAARSAIESESERQRAAAVARVTTLQRAATGQVEQRIVEIDRDLRTLASENKPTLLDTATQLLGSDAGALQQQVLRTLRQSLLQHERGFLDAMLGLRDRQQEYQRMLVDGPAELERRRLAHAEVHRKLQYNEQLQRALIAADKLNLRLLPLTDLYQRMRELREDEAALRRSNSAAAKAYAEQKALNQQLKAPASLQAFDLPNQLVPQISAALLAERQALEQRLESNWLGTTIAKIRGDFAAALPAALTIVVAIVLTPIAIKALLYFVLAPLAARRPAIAVLPHSGGTVITLPDTAARGGVAADAASSVSRAVEIDATDELLVHPEYLQSSPHHSVNQTRWLLDRRYWLASLASGLYAITRMRAEQPSQVVLSATRDPLSEIGAIIIPAGSAIVLQPRHLVGVLQQRDNPLRITSHWRLGSLHAWLTLQLRYLVFHGPTRLVVKGCRGVRIEPASAGRSINQAATIGFSANVGYSSRRSETFFSYLSGKQPLLHDSFSGAPGSYIYQEMPHAGGRRGGASGKGLQGLLDGLLKIVGI